MEIIHVFFFFTCQNKSATDTHVEYLLWAGMGRKNYLVSLTDRPTSNYFAEMLVNDIGV